jgi:prepilin-type N-terminal cleavage/methylation domain-containing protein
MKPEIILKLLKITKSTKKSAGFTLIELLVAAIITSIIVSIAGWGLVTLMSSKKVADTQTAMQGETNRAADFINDEIRRAQRIETNTDTTNLTVVAANFTPGSSTVVLALQIPGVNQRVIYYVDNSAAPWQGPKVIGRWGPALDSNGKYTNATTPTAWQKEVLIDRIASNNVSPTCGAGETQKNAPGFAACVTTTTAQIYINGEFKKPGDTYYSTGSSKTDTKAVSRINQTPANVPPTITLTSSRVSTSRDIGTQFTCKGSKQWIVKVTITIGNPSGDYRQVIINDSEDPNVKADPNLKTQVKEEVNNTETTKNLSSSVPLLGKDSPYKIAKYGSELKWINTKVKQNDDGTYSWTDGRSPATASASDYQGKVTITTTPTPPTLPSGENCDQSPVPTEQTNDIVVSTPPSGGAPDNRTFVPLFNGDTLPTTSTYTGQTGTGDVLTNDLIDHDNDSLTAKKANLGDNEVIILFELGQTASTQQGFDLNDKIVKLSW